MTLVKKNKIIISIIIALMGITAIFGGYLLYLINDLGNNINKDGKSNPIGFVDLITSSFDEPITVLALGVDSRGGYDIDSTRSDTIMVATLNTNTKQIAAVSFPRDTYVNIEGYGYTKLNHATAYGGVPLLTETLENNFDIEIDNYVVIDFIAFERIVDELGGIEVDVPKRMFYSGNDVYIDLYPGVQQLDGETLLDYVRFRNDSDGDLGRIKRQQEAIEALGEKATSLSAFLKAPDMFDILGEHIKTDLATEELLSIAKKYSSFSKNDWHSMTLGGEAARSEIDNLWYYFYTEEDREAIRIFLKSYENPMP